MKKSTISFVAAGAAILAIGTAGGASAGALITSHDIKDGTIRGRDVKNGSLFLKDLNGTAVKELQNGKTGPAGADGKTGAAGADGIAGLYYVRAKYGTTYGEDFTKTVNAGAIATVACNAETDVAISGGVQTLGLGEGGQAAAVASSFPGRMDWATNAPKADRLDGWIVQFDATRDPRKADIWVLCATGADVPVTTKTLS